MWKVGRNVGRWIFAPYSCVQPTPTVHGILPHTKNQRTPTVESAAISNPYASSERYVQLIIGDSNKHAYRHLIKSHCSNADTFLII